MNISRLTVSSVGEIDSKKDPKALPRKELGRAVPYPLFLKYGTYYFLFRFDPKGQAHSKVLRKNRVVG